MGIRFFPPRARLLTYALYGFVRTADDLVDETYAGRPEAAAEALAVWIDRWRAAHRTGRSEDPIFRSLLWCLREARIDPALIDAFLAAMLQDTRQERYESFDELQEYVYGSASVIGLMMAQICGVRSPDAYRYADRLGVAFQLTNFLRDIEADLFGRRRLYLPLEDLRRFEVSVDDLVAQRRDARFRALMAFQVRRARCLYRLAEPGIALLADWRCRAGVRAAAAIYEAILDKIEQQEYDVFGRRVATSGLEKALIATRTGLRLT